jgi:hypothetical protein
MQTDEFSQACETVRFRAKLKMRANQNAFGQVELERRLGLHQIADIFLRLQHLSSNGARP